MFYYLADIWLCAFSVLNSFLFIEHSNVTAIGFHNNLIFNVRMLHMAKDMDLVLEDIYGTKGRMAEDVILQQVLVYDLARQLRRPVVVASVDASRCYDRVAHAMAELTLRAYKVCWSSVLVMLHPLQCMKFFL